MKTHEQDKAYMQLALGQARAALAHDWIPVGAVFVLNGSIIAIGSKTGMVHPRFDHAEHNGCYRALWGPHSAKDLEGCDVFSTMEPCILCMAMLMTLRVRRILYGMEDPYGGGGFILKNREILPPRFKDQHPVLVGGVCRDESRELLRQFFRTNLAKDESGPWRNPDNPLVRACMQ